MVERNTGLPPDRRIEFRVGVHLGEVVEEADGDLMGDGVNIAARLEGVCEPGAICLSEDAYRQVSGRLDMTVADLGPTPAQEHRTAGPGLFIGSRRTAPRRSPRSRQRSLVTRLRAAAHRRRYRSPRWPRGGGLVWLHAVAVPFRSAHFPAIAVLPFDDLSPDKSLGYLGDGVSEDMIGMLSRFTDLSVIARNSSFVYKGKPVDIRQVGHDLNVDYALEGSVRRDADQIRVTAQLVDARTGDHVWAEHYDRAGNDPSALQNEATEKIVRAITGDLGVIKKAQYHDAWAKDTANLSEYDYYLRTHDLINTASSKEATDRAARTAEEGLAKYPDRMLSRCSSRGPLHRHLERL